MTITAAGDEIQPAARVQVLNFAPVLPGKCVVCGGTSERQFIDFGFDIDFYGRVYFCSDCMVQVASALGYYDPIRVNKIKTENMTMKSRIKELEDERVEHMAALRAKYSANPDFSSIHMADGSDDKSTIKSDVESNRESSGPERETVSNSAES